MNRLKYRNWYQRDVGHDKLNLEHQTTTGSAWY